MATPRILTKVNGNPVSKEKESVGLDVMTSGRAHAIFAHEVAWSVGDTEALGALLNPVRRLIEPASADGADNTWVATRDANKCNKADRAMMLFMMPAS